jgi:hypothetical protein
VTKLIRIVFFAVCADGCGLKRHGWASEQNQQFRVFNAKVKSLWLDRGGLFFAAAGAFL